MKNSLVIIGAGGHGKVCAEIAELNGYGRIHFLDDSSEAVSGTTADIPKYLQDCDFFVAIGNNELRKSFIEKIEGLNGSIATLIHPAACVSPSAVIEKGTAVMAGAVISAASRLGKGVIVNTCSSADHDNVLGNYVHLGVGTHLAGTVEIGECTFVGAGATVINNISICEDCIIGAGATVISDICEKGTYVGTPARKLK